MARPNDRFWDFVEKLDDGRFNCTFCGYKFAAATSVSRIKWHLSGVRGHGVAICDKVPEDVQEAAFQAVHRDNKRHKSIASSSNVNDNAISTTPQEQNNNEVVNLAGDAGTTQAPDIMGHALGRSWDEIYNFLMEDDTENGTRGVVQPGAGASSSGGLTCNTNSIKVDAVPTTKLVGQAFKDHKKTIWSWLMHDEVSTIGIYGMGGVGKTTLVTHIYNQLLERRGTFCHVYWITVSQDTSINKLQNSIARRIGLDLSTEDEELYRASKLSKELTKKQKWVLILDDLWKAIEPRKVGVPIQAVKGCKLILTTRLEKVCQQMDTEHKIKVSPILEEEAWTLFIERLRHQMALSPEVEQIAKSITKECDGLPLGIITMAGIMKGVKDIHEWRNALEDLRQSRVRKDDMEPEVFHILRYSYNHLSEAALQQCFLCCALFPEDFEIRREDLIAYLIDEGVIKGLESREAEFNKGHSMLNKLERVCLLESAKEGYYDDRCVKMHDLIRDMAMQILQENSQSMVKAGARLREVPGAEEWTENLTRVSLMHNQIEEIPSTHSPRCPSLSTLLLCDNSKLQFIADLFFEQLYELKVLDLSRTNITKLPDSVSELVSLTALLLIDCDMLRHVPSLEKLKALKRLDLSGTWALEKIPQGMECLCNLRYLRMNGCGEKELPSGLLSKLSHLQVFVVEEGLSHGRYAPVTVKGKEVGCLRKLETLDCHFEGYSDYVEYLNSRDKTRSLTEYRIVVGLPREKCYTDGKDKVIVLDKLTINRDGDFQDMFWKDIQQLTMVECDGAKSLCYVSSLIKNAIELEVIHIKDCNTMESLVSSSWFCSAPLPLPSYNGIFSGLKEFYCYGCRSMKKLFPLVLLPSLVNLERIEVVNCEKMEEIIGGIRSDEEEVTGEESSSSGFKLPKLRALSLIGLPELESICSAKLICDSLEVIWIVGCKELKRIPICFSLLENGEPSSLISIKIYPKEWWESVVEWEHRNAKDVLHPFVKFLAG
ncbi:probable disease resistance protein At4g27220 [Populus nigra]|uniref:probable disease resistance protein At4g27220 n=1 Tax=Populus nigra TaxID=3691 RepID=UPI002B26957E|nr:probable disease resistance protein At4g27220 [Populus nigra]XP_061944554.1 probable disease resistance protein At4g27220 [Populus nigra]XP_061944555.1 probable disease resistance protein At4g27220 [Populus nigra]